jgi:hypothetical protein
MVPTAACSGGPHADSITETERAEVIYDSDDRGEVFEFSDTTVRALAARTVALGRWSDLRFDEAGRVAISAPSWMEAAGLCPDQRFSNQPAFALCTGLLVGRDLVLTAAHCLRSGEQLSELALVEGFRYESEHELATIGRDDVHAILEVLAEEPGLDVAWLRFSNPLDEPVPWSPVPVPPDIDTPVIGINHGGGIPAKVDAGGRVIEADAGRLFVDLDAFGGASGGPVFSREGALVGILTAGAGDYELAERDCFTYARTTAIPGLNGELAVGPDDARSVLCERVIDAPPCPEPIEAALSAEAGCSVACGRRGQGSWLTLFAAVLWMAAGARRFTGRSGQILPRTDVIVR